MGNKLKQNLIPLSLMLIIPIVNIVYPLLNNNNRGVSTIITKIDTMVPFIKAFSVPYMAWYPFVILYLVYLCFNDRKTYYKSLISLILSLIVCYIIFFFFQTTVPRPQVQGNDLFSKIVMFIYKTDKPFNAFPSIHVITTYIVMRGIYSSKVRDSINMTVVIIVGMLIIFSTQFIKQHVILDLTFAILLGEVIYNIVDYSMEMILKWRKKRSSLLMMRKKLET